MSPPAPALPLTAISQGHRFRLKRDGLAGRIALALLLSMSCAAALIALAGHNPFVAFAAIVEGAVGSPHQIGAALNRCTPYLLAGGGVAFCLRAGIINIGAEGQIAMGGAGAAAAAFAFSGAPPVLATLAALTGGVLPERPGRAWRRRSISGDACMRFSQHCCSTSSPSCSCSNSSPARSASLARASFNRP